MKKEIPFSPPQAEKSKDQTILSGQKVAKIAESLYSRLDSRLATHLVRPNVVLTLAGLKGMADVHWVTLNKDIISQLDALNREFAPQFIYFQVPESFKKSPAEDGQVNVFNGRALARKSQITTIPGVPRYETSQGSGELLDWFHNLFDNLDNAQREGKIPKEVDIQILWEGIVLGYPDQAIRDFEKCLRTGDIHQDLKFSPILEGIPYAEKYGAPVPEFNYYSAHENDPEIAEYITKARRILTDFYDSAWHQKLAKDPVFLKTNQTEKEKAHRLFLERQKQRKKEGKKPKDQTPE